jgi:hypothetical protein
MAALLIGVGVLLGAFLFLYGRKIGKKERKEVKKVLFYV